MASINYGAKEISVKIVYYGPGLSGKTTNLQVIHQKIPKESKSSMVSLATETDRTLFFDFLPLDLGKIKGFSTKFQLYTVPGQVYYNATRKLVLRGVDGVVFVADSAPNKIDENLESLQNLIDNLAEYGYNIDALPIVIQYNKRDLPNAMPIEELQRLINKQNRPWSEACAVKGKGIFETLKMIGKTVIDELNKKYSRPSGPASIQRPMAPSAPAQTPSASPAAPQRSSMPPVSTSAWQASPTAYAPSAPSPMAQPRPAAPQQRAPEPQMAPLQMQDAYSVSEPQQYSPQPSPATPEPGFGAAKKPAPQAPAKDYYDYNTVNLDPLSDNDRRTSSAQADPRSAETARRGESAYAQPMQEKTDLDLEIEKYQREIEERQRTTGSFQQPAAAPVQPTAPRQQAAQPQQYYQQQPAAPQYPQQQQGYGQQQYAQPAYQPPQQQQAYPQYQQQAYAAPTFEQQPQAPVRPQYSQSVNAQDYNVYQADPSAGRGIPPQTQQPFDLSAAAPQEQQPNNGGDEPMFFTSVDTDKTRKKPRRPLNPKEKGKGGFFSKLLGKKEADE
jgi:hypothetical protein